MTVPLELPAARAFARSSRASWALGLLGVAAFVPVLIRVLEIWRISPAAASHRVSILGQPLSYPAANVGALIVLALAGLGAIATARALRAIARELRVARRLNRYLAELRPRRRGDVLVIEDPRAEAFCAGLIRPRVYITTGALAVLDEPARHAVLRHEARHARRHDALRLAVGRVIAESLFFLPGLRELRREQAVLAEVSADEYAVAGAAGDPSALASAMVSFAAVSPGAGWSGIDPARVDHLLGTPPSWRFPALVGLAALALLALVVAGAVIAGRAAAGSASLDPPFLSAQPCIVMLALIPVGVSLTAAAFLRRRPVYPLAHGTSAAPGRPSTVARARGRDHGRGLAPGRVHHGQVRGGRAQP